MCTLLKHARFVQSQRLIFSSFYFAFFVPSNMVDYLLEEFCKTIDESIENKYIGSDEKVFDITYIRDKSKYHLVKCTWREYFKLFEND